MTIIARRQREKEELRQLILDGAARVLRKEGYEHLSVRKVAKEISYSPGTIYVYYRDKDELLLALHRALFAKKVENYAPLANIANPIERIMEMGRIYIQTAIDDPDGYYIMFVANAPMAALACQEEEWTLNQTGFGLLCSFIQEAIDKGMLRAEVDVNGTALMLWSMVHGVSMLHLSERLQAFGEFIKADPMDSLFTQIRFVLDQLKP